MPRSPAGSGGSDSSRPRHARRPPPGSNLVVLTDTTLFGRRDQLARLTAKRRLPSMAWTSEFAQSGLLMSYGPSIVERHRRADEVVQ